MGLARVTDRTNLPSHEVGRRGDIFRVLGPAPHGAADCLQHAEWHPRSSVPKPTSDRFEPNHYVAMRLARDEHGEVIEETSTGPVVSGREAHRAAMGVCMEDDYPNLLSLSRRRPAPGEIWAPMQPPLVAGDLPLGRLFELSYHKNRPAGRFGGRPEAHKQLLLVTLENVASSLFESVATPELET